MFTASQLLSQPVAFLLPERTWEEKADRMGPDGLPLRLEIFPMGRAVARQPTDAVDLPLRCLPHLVAPYASTGVNRLNPIGQSLCVRRSGCRLRGNCQASNRRSTVSVSRPALASQSGSVRYT